MLKKRKKLVSALNPIVGLSLLVRVKELARIDTKGGRNSEYVVDGNVSFATFDRADVRAM